jgi:hypothetical protein
MNPFRYLTLALALALFTTPMAAQEPQARQLYWGDEVPPGWTGEWADELRTVPEKTGFRRTMTMADLHDFIDELRWRSEHVHVLNVFRTPLGRMAPAVVLANPRVTSAREARESGKPVIYLQGNIHPPESEGAEAMLMVIRDILFGDRRHLLDDQIIIVMPILNVDGMETLGHRTSAPYVHGTRGNAHGLDLNRDGVKVETAEVMGLYRTIFNPWDPVLIYDAHRMGSGNYAYANAYVNSTVPAAHPGPRGYVRDTLFPAVRDAVRDDFGLETFTHALWEGRDWPPTVWHHDNTIWTVEAKFVANAYGLRNRMSILTETPGAAGFERQIYAHYAYILSLLEYTNAQGREMLEVVRAADEETVARVLAGAESGELRNYLDGEYHSRGTIDLLAYREVRSEYVPGTSVRATVPVAGPPEVVTGVDDVTLPVGTRDAWVPRGYLIPAWMGDLVTKLETHNIRVDTLEAPLKAEGEQYVVDRMVRLRRSGGPVTALEGGFQGPSLREFPAGSFYVDMAQPMANAAFYFLEPEARDGFVGWGVLDDVLQKLGVHERPVVYPIFKFRREAPE